MASTSPAPRRDPRAPRDELASTRWVAWLLDDVVRVPGTSFGVGLDAIVGLVPGIGDGVGTVLSGVVLTQAVRQGVPIPVLLQMIGNLGVDALLGLVPGVGDVADAAHRANRKNMKLLQAAVADPARTRRTSTGYVIVAGTLVVVTVLALGALAAMTLWALWKVLSIKI